MDNKQKAQQRADQVRAFNDELEMLEVDGICKLGNEQRTAISRYHQQLLTSLTASFDIDTTSRQKQLSAGMKFASLIGALALASSVFLMFYQFWGFLSTPVQVAILVVAPLLTLAMSWWVSRRETTGYFAKLLSMVSFACFVLNVATLGQIFNIAPSDKALLAWAAYGFLLAYAFDVRLLLAMGILSLAAFIAIRVGTWSGMYWLDVGQRPENFFAPALMIFSVPLWLRQERFSGFTLIYRVFGCLMFFIPVLVLSNWSAGSYLPWSGTLIEGFYQVVGFLVSAAAIALGIRRQWPDVVSTGNTFFVLFLYTKFFDWWWEIMPKYLFFLVIALTSLLLLLVYKRMRLHSQATGVSHE